MWRACHHDPFGSFPGDVSRGAAAAAKVRAEQRGRVAAEQAARRMIEGLSALTLATHDMGQAVQFYRTLGFELLYGGEDTSFTSFRVGGNYLNLVAAPAGRQWLWWGRAIFYVADVDAFHARLLAAGIAPQMPPRDAPWGERFFHVTDPDGHELSFARPLAPRDGGQFSP